MRYRLFLLLLPLLLLTGCASFSLDADALIAPPSAQGDGSELQRALEEQLGTGFVLRFPRSGDNRSAIVRHDIDLDGVGEALVFYRPSAELSGTSVALLDYDSGDGWVVRYNNAIGMYIDRVMFGDLDGDSCDEIILGWTSYNGSSALYVYDYYSGELSPMHIADALDGFTYDEFCCGDFDGDGRDEIVVALLERRTAGACAYMLEYALGRGTSIAAAARTPLCPESFAYAGSVSGRLSGTVYAMALYCEKSDGTGFYETVSFDSESGVFASLVHEGVRTSELGAMDVDGDGLLEFSFYPGDKPEDPTLFAAQWYSLSPEPAAELYSMEFPYDGLRLILPDGWRSQVQFSRTTSGVIVCSLGEAGTVFELCLFTHERWADVQASARRANRELTVLAKDESSVLAVYLGECAPELGVTEDMVAEMIQHT